MAISCRIAVFIDKYIFTLAFSQELYDKLDGCYFLIIFITYILTLPCSMKKVFASECRLIIVTA